MWSQPAVSRAVHPQVSWEPAPEARAVLEQLGRTEDVRFSPDNRRLAIAAFFRDAIAIVDLALVDRDGRPHVCVTRAEELRGPGIVRPHGVEFLDAETIIVANRGRHLDAYRLPPADGGAAGRALTRIDLPGSEGFSLIAEPGSVRRGPVSGELFVCDNAGNQVTRHEIVTDAGSLRVARSDRCPARGLGIPDGVAVSVDGRMLAVSNHLHQCVLVYDRGDISDLDAVPRAVLRGVVYPHGLRFVGAEHLLVTDTSRPYVHRFTAPGGAWAGVHYPDATVQIMSDEDFLRGHHNALEGGPKGLDIDRTGRLVATTCASQPLAFFLLDDLVAHGADPSDELLRFDFELAVLDQRGEAIARALEEEALHTQRLRNRTAAAEEQAAAAEARAAEAEARAAHSEELRLALEQTKTFRAVAPLRRWYARLRRGRAAPPGGP
jgi:hypothetical protein